MKKYIKVFIIGLLCFCLTGCKNKESQIIKDIENQLASIKVGDISLSDYDIYERINVSDKKLYVDDIKNTNLNNIFANIEYEIKDIEVNNSTATATISIKAKDIDTILSADSVVSELIIEYDNYKSLHPNDDRTVVDTVLLNKICDIINKNNTFVTNEVIVSVFYDKDESIWKISYDDSFLDCLLGVMETEYKIDFNDICEEEKKDVNISYNYDKILNLPNNNKSTRSSIKTPVSVNQEAYFDNSDYFYESQRYELKIKLTDVIRGKEAYDMLKACSENDISIKSGEEFIIFELDIKLLNNLTSKEKLLFSTSDFSLLDNTNHYYNNCIVFGIDEFQPISEGESTKGYVCFTIEKNATPYLLFKDYMDNTICFSN